MNWKNVITFTLFLIALSMEAFYPTSPLGIIGVIWPWALVNKNGEIGA